MGVLLERVATSSVPLVWLDDMEYSVRLLGIAGSVWSDVAALTAFRRKAASLLRSDVTVIPIGAIVEAALKADEDLLGEMRGKKRPVAPLRILLGDTKVRSIAVDAAEALCANMGSKPVVATIPSPRRWISEAYNSAHGSEIVDVGGEEIDSASVYVAEFLRALGGTGIHALLLEEGAADEPTCAQQITWYRPIINIGHHYRWDVGLSLPDGSGFAGECDSLGFVISPHPPVGTVAGIATPASFWAGASPPAVPTGGFRFVQIPANASPEGVLQRLGTLRAP